MTTTVKKDLNLWRLDTVLLLIVQNIYNKKNNIILLQYSIINELNARIYFKQLWGIPKYWTDFNEIE